MRYCEYCMLLTVESLCPNCHSRLREPKGNDPVYLLTREALWAGGIEEALGEHGIPCMKRGQRGEWFHARAGYAGQELDFFVPFAAYEKSKELLCDLLEPEE